MLTPLLASLHVYRNQVVPVRLDIADGDGMPVPPLRAGRLDAMAGELAAEGFAAIAAVAPGDPDAPGTVYARVLVHPQDATRAWAIDMVRGELVQSYVELVTEWEDGTALCTVSHTNPTIFEPLPRLRQNLVPGAGVAELVARHRAACSDVGGMRLDPAAQHPVAAAQAQNREVLAHQERCGILRRRGEDYGFTLRGAWRSTFTLYRAQQA